MPCRPMTWRAIHTCPYMMGSTSSEVDFTSGKERWGATWQEMFTGWQRARRGWRNRAAGLALYE